MPTNFSGSLKPLVALKTGEKCSLKRHFSGCIRQVIGFLDLLASNDPDRLVFIRVDEIQKRCRKWPKSAAKGKSSLYSKSMIEKALKCCRDEGILSHSEAIPIQQRRGFVIDNAFVMAPHDALAIRQEYACRYVGMGRVPGTTWAAGPGGNVWFVAKGRRGVVPPLVTFTAGAGAARGLGITDEITVPITDQITDRITVPITVSNHENAASNYGAGYGPDASDSVAARGDIEESDNVFRNFSNGEPRPNQLSQISQRNQGNHVNWGNSQADDPKGVRRPRSSRDLTDRPTPSTMSTATNEPARPPAAPARTVGSYFASAGPNDILRLITDGTFEQENRANRKYLAKDEGFKLLKRACLDTIAAKSKAPLRTTADLGDLMYSTMARLRKEHELNAPTPWLPCLTRLRERKAEIQEALGDARTFSALSTPTNYSHRFCYGWLHEVFHQAVIETNTDLTPWEAQLNTICQHWRSQGLLANTQEEKVAAMRSYTDGVQAIRAVLMLLKDSGEQPKPLLDVGNWLWEHDATRPKDASAPWMNSAA